MTFVREAELTAHTLRNAYGMFPSGVTAICCQRGGTPTGMAASSFTPVSLAPPLVSVCIANASTTWPVLRAATRVGISVLGEDHPDIARSLSSKEGDRFARIAWESADDGSVYVHGSSLWLDCALDSEITAGDHSIAVLRVLGLQPWPDISPMIFHGSRFRQLGS